MGGTESPVPAAVVEAVQHGNLHEFLEFLQSHSDNRELPVIDAEGCSLLHWAALNNRSSYVHLLLERGADINYAGGVLNETPIQWAVRGRQHCALILDLIRKGADIHYRSNLGMDALQIAVRSGNVIVSYILLSHHAKVDSPDMAGDTALLWLMKNLDAENAADLMRLLLRFGADLHKEDAYGWNCMHVLSSSKKRKPQYVFSLVNKYGGSVMRHLPSSVNGNTPAQMAYSSGNYEMMQFMLDMQLYHTLPSALIILSNAISVFSLFFFLDIFGWIKGILCFLVAAFFNSRMAMITIEVGSSRHIHGKVYGLIAGLSYIYQIHLSTRWPIHVQAFTLTGIAIIFSSLFVTYYTRPCAPISQDSSELLLSTTQLQQTPPLRICTSCLVDKSRTSMHCGKCDQCITDLDHHCPFVGTCVGPLNRRVFVLFTAAASITCLFVFIMSIRATHFEGCKDVNILSTQQCYFFKYPVIFLTTWTNLIVCIWVGAICHSQLVLVAAETTTFETIRTRNSLYVQRRLASGLCKAFKNIIAFIYTGRYVVTKHVDDDGSAGGCCDASNDDGHSHSHDHGHSHNYEYETDIESGGKRSHLQ